MAGHDDEVFSQMTRDMVSPWEEHRRFDTAVEAETYAERLCTGIYSDRNEIAYQKPFHALDEGDAWRVSGSRPYGWPTNPMTGPMTVVIEKASGRVIDVFFTGGPKGWDKEILEKLRREGHPVKTE